MLLVLGTRDCLENLREYYAAGFLRRSSVDAINAAGIFDTGVGLGDDHIGTVYRHQSAQLDEVGREAIRALRVAVSRTPRRICWKTVI